MTAAQGWLFDERLAAAEAAADNAGDAWRAQAFELVVRYARTHEVFLIEDVRAWPEAVTLPPPPDNRAWGAVAMRALREKIVVREGLRHDRYASQKHLWRSLVMGQL
jgi:hypothetical protein